MRVFRPLLHRNYALFWSSDLIASVRQFVRDVALYCLGRRLRRSRFLRGCAKVVNGRRGRRHCRSLRPPMTADRYSVSLLLASDWPGRSKFSG